MMTQEARAGIIFLPLLLQNILNRNDKSEHIPYLENVVRIIIVWSEWRDLNPRPHGPEPCALPTALHPDVQHGYYKDFSARCQEREREIFEEFSFLAPRRYFTSILHDPAFAFYSAPLCFALWNEEGPKSKCEMRNER